MAKTATIERPRQSDVLAWLVPKSEGEAYALDYAKAIELGREGRYEEALAVFDRLIASDPENYSIYPLRGAALWGLGRDREAVAAALVAVKHAADEPHALAYSATALEEMGQVEVALAIAEDALALDPDNQLESSAYAHLVRADVLSLKGIGDEAAASFEKAGDIFLHHANAEGVGRVRLVLQSTCYDLAECYEENGYYQYSSVIFRNMYNILWKQSQGTTDQELHKDLIDLYRYIVTSIPDWYSKAAMLNQDKDNQDQQFDDAMREVARRYRLPVERVDAVLQAAAQQITVPSASAARPKWERDRRPDENPAEFAWRAYAAEAQAGTLNRGVIAREDKPLAVKLASWLRSHPMPAGIDIPTLPEWNSRRLERLRDNPGAREVIRLLNVERHRNHKARRSLNPS